VDISRSFHPKPTLEGNHLVSEWDGQVVDFSATQVISVQQGVHETNEILEQVLSSNGSKPLDGSFDCGTTAIEGAVPLTDMLNKYSSSSSSPQQGEQHMSRFPAGSPWQAESLAGVGPADVGQTDNPLPSSATFSQTSVVQTNKTPIEPGLLTEEELQQLHALLWAPAGQPTSATPPAPAAAPSVGMLDSKSEGSNGSAMVSRDIGLVSKLIALENAGKPAISLLITMHRTITYTLNAGL
jgi:hypothetical protein